MKEMSASEVARRFSQRWMARRAAEPSSSPEVAAESPCWCLPIGPAERLCSTCSPPGEAGSPWTTRLQRRWTRPTWVCPDSTRIHGATDPRHLRDRRCRALLVTKTVTQAMRAAGSEQSGMHGQGPKQCDGPGEAIQDLASRPTAASCRAHRRTLTPGLHGIVMRCKAPGCRSDSIPAGRTHPAPGSTDSHRSSSARRPHRRERFPTSRLQTPARRRHDHLLVHHPAVSGDGPVGRILRAPPPLPRPIA